MPCWAAAALRPDAVLIVADATALGRALYLAGEIIDTGARVVVALNMIDEAQAQRLDDRRGAAVGRPGRAGRAHRRARRGRDSTR